VASSRGPSNPRTRCWDRYQANRQPSWIINYFLFIVFVAQDSGGYKGRIAVGEMQLKHDGVKQVPANTAWQPPTTAAAVTAAAAASPASLPGPDELWFYFSFIITNETKKREETTIASSDDKNAAPIKKVHTVIVKQSIEYYLLSKNRVELQNWMGSIEAMAKIEQKRTQEAAAAAAAANAAAGTPSTPTAAATPAATTGAPVRK